MTVEGSAARVEQARTIMFGQQRAQVLVGVRGLMPRVGIGGALRPVDGQIDPTDLLERLSSVQELAGVLPVPGMRGDDRADVFVQDREASSVMSEVRLGTPVASSLRTASSMMPLESSARMITVNAEAIAFCVTEKTSSGSAEPDSNASSRIVTPSSICLPCALAALSRYSSEWVRIRGEGIVGQRGHGDEYAEGDRRLLHPQPLQLVGRPLPSLRLVVE